MLSGFSKTKQQTTSADTVLLNISCGTLTFGVTKSGKPFKNDFENTLYPHQRVRALVAILLLVSIHFLIAFFLVHKSEESPVLLNEERGQLIFLNLQAKNQPNIVIEHPQPQKKQQRERTRSSISRPMIDNQVEIASTTSSDIASQIAAAREKRQALEQEAAQQNQIALQSPSEEDAVTARIKANIQSANYNRKGTNGIFQVVNKGVQTGRFSFRGWANDPRKSTWQTYDVDAGVGGDVELALINRMIELIREHYSGDFNWESQRLGRVVVLSARPKDTANLERFMMKEFFE